MLVTFNPSIQDVYLGDYMQLDGLAIVRDRLLGDYDLATISELTIEVFAVFRDLITPKSKVDRSNKHSFRLRLATVLSTPQLRFPLLRSLSPSCVS